MHPSWLPQYPQPTLLISNLQNGLYYLQQQLPTIQQQLPTIQQQPLLSLYKLVPLQQESAPRQTSPQMRIYDESNPKQYIEKSEDAIMKEFTKFLEENPNKISELSTSNIKVSYKISPIPNKKSPQNELNELSLSFDFEPSNRQNQNSITFVNSRGDQHKATKNTDIQYLEKQIVITSDDSPSTSHFIIPNEVAIALKKYVKNTGEIPTHNLIISVKNNEFFFKESQKEVDEVKDNQCFIVKLKNSDDTITIGRETRESLEKIVEEEKIKIHEEKIEIQQRALKSINKIEYEDGEIEKKMVKALAKLKLMRGLEELILEYIEIAPTKIKDESKPSSLLEQNEIPDYSVNLILLQSEIKLLEKKCTEDFIAYGRESTTRIPELSNKALEIIKQYSDEESSLLRETSMQDELKRIANISPSALHLIETHSKPTNLQPVSALSKINDLLTREEQYEQNEYYQTLIQESKNESYYTKKFKSIPAGDLLLKTALVTVSTRDEIKEIKSMITAQLSLQEASTPSSIEDSSREQQEEKIYKILLVESKKDEKIQSLLTDFLLEDISSEDKKNKFSLLMQLLNQKIQSYTESPSLDSEDELKIIKDLKINFGLKLLDSYNKKMQEFEEVNRNTIVSYTLAESVSEISQNNIRQNFDNAGIKLENFEKNTGISRRDLQKEIKRLEPLDLAIERVKPMAKEFNIASDPDFSQKLEMAIERQTANQPQPAPSSPSTTSTPPALRR